MKKKFTSIFIAFLFSAISPNSGFGQCPATYTCQVIPGAAANGVAIAYRNPSGANMMIGVDTAIVSGSAFYLTVPDSGQYIFKFVPNIGNGYQICYSDTMDSWQTATVYNNVCAGGSFVNFIPSTFASIGSGSGSISGQIVEGTGFGQKPNGVTAPGNPIGGIVVKGGKNPGAQFFAQTVTDANGQYSFTNLPDGDYFILVDIPGLDTNSTHHITLSGGNSVNNAGFIAGSNGVTPSTNVGVKQLANQLVDLRVYPNPAKNAFELEFSIEDASRVLIELFSIEGKLIKKLEEIKDFKGTYKSKFFTDTKPGNYFVKTTINNDEYVHKIIITQ